tara:strand:- start:130 stop:360 length:231 start_codon:yes stop_codon:yes gene_type:complete
VKVEEDGSLLQTEILDGCGGRGYTFTVKNATSSNEADWNVLLAGVTPAYFTLHIINELPGYVFDFSVEFTVDGVQD